MPLDNKVNFGLVTVDATGYNASATSVTLLTGHAARLPTVPFNATWWNATDYSNPSDDPNREIVRVTAIATDTLTVMRGQESITATTKNTASKTYKMLAGLTAKDFNTDLPATIAAAVVPAGSTTQVQFNNAGAFGADAGLTYDASGDLLAVKGSPGANTAPVFGLELFNINPATVGNQQNSGGLFFEGNGWKTTATAASQSVEFRMFCQPVQGTTAPTGNLLIGHSINLAAYTNNFTFNTAGQFIIAQSGSASAPAIYFGTDTTSGFYRVAADRIGISLAGGLVFDFKTDGLHLPSTGIFAGAGQVWWDNTGNFGALKNGANLLFYDQSGAGATIGLAAGVWIVPKTANYTVVVSDSGKHFNNVGAAGSVTFTLPTGAAGMQYTFEVDATQTITIQAGGSDTIRNGTVVSAAGGTMTANANGCIVHLVCTKANTWKVKSIIGTWTGPT